MSEDLDIIAARLEAIAAIAKATAYDVRHSRLWEGDLNNRLGQIYEMLKLIPIERR
jgi:hypothetical protein